MSAGTSARRRRSPGADWRGAERKQIGVSYPTKATRRNNFIVPFLIFFIKITKKTFVSIFFPGKGTFVQITFTFSLNLHKSHISYFVL